MLALRAGKVILRVILQGDYQVPFRRVTDGDVFEDRLRFAVDHADFVFAADVDVGGLAVRSEAEPVDAADHRQYRDLRIIRLGDVMDMYQIMFDVTAPDFLLVRTQCQTVTAAPLLLKVFGDSVSNGMNHFSLGNVGHLKSDQTVDVLKVA